MKCTSQDEDTLKSSLLSGGPTSICVYAESWQLYKGGILSNKNCKSSYYTEDHCVGLVGFSDWGKKDGYCK